MSEKQLDVLFRWFAAGHSITTYEATVKFGICRLSERCRELRAKGWDIRGENERSNGKTYKRYWMPAGELFETERAGLGGLTGLPLRGSQTSATRIRENATVGDVPTVAS